MCVPRVCICIFQPLVGIRLFARNNNLSCEKLNFTSIFGFLFVNVCACACAAALYFIEDFFLFFKFLVENKVNENSTFERN